MTEVALLVEGNLDAEVGARLLAHVGLDLGPVYGRRGWTYVRQSVRAFNTAAEHRPMLALVDLMDTGFECAAEVRAEWLPHRHPNLLLRFAKPEIESWLLADRGGFSQFLNIRKAFMPMEPDALPDAKEALLSLAARSRNRSRKSAIVPTPGHYASQGPLYNLEIGAFVNEQWSIASALDCSPSLRSAVNRLQELRARLAQL